MYIIKNHYEATQNNPNFAGEIRNYYEGKAGNPIGNDNVYPSKWEIENYGYKTLAAAKKGLKRAVEMARWETEKGFWTVSAELIEC